MDIGAIRERLGLRCTIPHGNRWSLQRIPDGAGMTVHACCDGTCRSGASGRPEHVLSRAVALRARWRINGRASLTDDNG